MKHEIRISPSQYLWLIVKELTFLELDSSKPFQRGDELTLREWDDTPINSTSHVPKGYTGSDNIECKIGFIKVARSGDAIASLINVKVIPTEAPKRESSKGKSRAKKSAG